MRGSDWEGGHVFAWGSLPSEYAVKNSGAHLGVIISFKTSAPFVPDDGISDPKVAKFFPVRSLFSGSIHVWDVKIVRIFE